MGRSRIMRYYSTFTISFVACNYLNKNDRLWSLPYTYISVIDQLTTYTYTIRYNTNKENGGQCFDDEISCQCFNDGQHCRMYRGISSIHDSI